MLWFIYKLEAQAKNKGGRVHYLLGNHEYMILYNDLRYIHEKYKTSSTLLNLEYDELYSDKTIIGRWLRSKSTIVKINNNIFTHGGISEDFISYGDFNLENKIDHFQLHSLKLTGNEATLNIKGIYENNGHFNGTIQLNKLDVSEWITKGNQTNLSGYVLLDGDFINSQISALDLNVEVDESILFERKPSSISGGVSFRNFQLEITNPLTLTIGPSIVEVKGVSDFKSKTLDLNLSLTDASTFLINNFWEDSLSSGRATGSMYLKGPFDALGINCLLYTSDSADE